MPFIDIQNINLHYEKTGSKGKTIILLHGWGQNTEMMKPIAVHFENDFVVYNLDLPGFGQSGQPDRIYTIYDYATVLKNFVDEMNIENPILIGHSFGVRIAIIYASLYPVDKMVFTGGAGIRDRRGLDYYLKVYSYKASKQLFKLPFLKGVKEKLQANMGSEDYKNTSGVMRGTFVQVVNEDLTNLLSKIQCEVFLVWGELDEATPLWMGQQMEKMIPNAGLAVFKGDNHYAYFNQMPRFLACLDAFFANDRKG